MTTQVCPVLAKSQLRPRISPKKLRKKKARMKCSLVKTVPTLSTIYLPRHNPILPIYQVMLLESGLNGTTAFLPHLHHHRSSPRRISPLTTTTTNRDYLHQVGAPIAQSMIGLVPGKANSELDTKTFNSRSNKKIVTWRIIDHSIRHQAQERLTQITTVRIAATTGKSNIRSLKIFNLYSLFFLRNSYDPYYSSMAPPVRNDVYYQQRSLDPPPGFGSDMSNSLRRRHVTPISDSWDMYTSDEQRRQREEEVNKKVQKLYRQ